MLNITYRKYGIRLTHCWFASQEDIDSEAFRKDAGDMIFLHGNNLINTEIILCGGGVKYTRQKTVIKKLGCTENELFHTLGKHLQQYIKRSQKENIVTTHIYEYQDWPKDELDNLKHLYEKMFQDKGIESKFNEQLFLQYASQHALTVGIAFKSEIPIGFSAVIHDGSCARLWLAAFDFRNDEMDAQVLSRAHQRLDWEMLCWCNDKGIKHFDFGGVNSFEQPNGIAQFKMKFENSNRVEMDNYLIPNNMIGRLALHFFLWRKG